VVLPSATVGDVSEALLSDDFRIVHFSGHADIVNHMLHAILRSVAARHGEAAARALQADSRAQAAVAQAAIDATRQIEEAVVNVASAQMRAQRSTDRLRASVEAADRRRIGAADDEVCAVGPPRGDEVCAVGAALSPCDADAAWSVAGARPDGASQARDEASRDPMCRRSAGMLGGLVARLSVPGDALPPAVRAALASGATSETPAGERSSHAPPAPPAKGHESPGHESAGHESPGHESPGHESPAPKVPTKIPTEIPTKVAMSASAPRADAPLAVDLALDCRQLLAAGIGSLAFEDELGNPHFVNPAALADCLAAHSPPLECVVFNACGSSIAGSLLTRSLPFAVCTAGALSDEAAVRWSQGFYSALGAGHGIERAYEAGVRRVALEARRGSAEAVAPVRDPAASPRSAWTRFERADRREAAGKDDEELCDGGRGEHAAGRGAELARARSGRSHAGELFPPPARPAPRPEAPPPPAATTTDPAVVDSGPRAVNFDRGLGFSERPPASATLLLRNAKLVAARRREGLVSDGAAGNSKFAAGQGLLGVHEENRRLREERKTMRSMIYSGVSLLRQKEAELAALRREVAARAARADGAEDRADDAGRERGERPPARALRQVSIDP
jgi:hypothetical protein